MAKELTKEQAIKTYVKGNTGEIQAISPEYKEAVVVLKNNGWFQLAQDALNHERQTHKPKPTTNFVEGRKFIEGSINNLEDTVKHGKLKIKRKKLKDSILGDIKAQIPNPERDKVCRKARTTAHSQQANRRRDLSNQVRQDMNLL